MAYFVLNFGKYINEYEIFSKTIMNMIHVLNFDEIWILNFFSMYILKDLSVLHICPYRKVQYFNKNGFLQI